MRLRFRLSGFARLLAWPFIGGFRLQAERSLGIPDSRPGNLGQLRAPARLNRNGILEGLTRFEQRSRGVLGIGVGAADRVGLEVEKRPESVAAGRNRREDEGSGGVGVGDQGSTGCRNQAHGHRALGPLGEHEGSLERARLVGVDDGQATSLHLGDLGHELQGVLVHERVVVAGVEPAVPPRVLEGEQQESGAVGGQVGEDELAGRIHTRLPQRGLAGRIEGRVGNDGK
jgi:hypothetical protein